jgi:hypothetical protein
MLLRQDLLQALEEKVFGLEFVEPDGVDHEDSVVVDVLEAGESYQHFPGQIQNYSVLGAKKVFHLSMGSYSNMIKRNFFGQ